MKLIQSLTEKWKFFKAEVQGEDNTYLLPWHPSLLLTSRCRSPSRRDFSSGEKESGSSTFCTERKYREIFHDGRAVLCSLLSDGVWEQLSHVLSGRAGGAAPVLGEMGAQGMSPRPALTTVSVIRSISCLSLVLCCLKGLCLWREEKGKSANKCSISGYFSCGNARKE